MATSISNATAMSTKIDQIHQLIAGYLLVAEEPTLEEFFKENIQSVASLTAPNTDIKRVWSRRYSLTCQEMAKDCIFGNVDWYATMTTINQVLAEHTSSGPATSQASKHHFINQMEAAYAKMGNDKWKLPSGTIVEDVMVKVARSIDYEHPAHSFILDIHDHCWENAFADEDLLYIKSFRVPKIPEIEDQEALAFLELFKEKNTYDDIMKALLTAPYSENESANVAWLRHTILTALMNHKKKFTEKHFSETDIIVHLWSQIIYCYGETDVEVNTGETESKATSSNKNADRTLKERKNHGTKTDMRFKWRGFELGSTEVGRLDEGEFGTKEFKESQLKLPKTMRDMLVELVKSHHDKKDDVKTFGYIMMGTAIKALTMDCIGNVCRVYRTHRYIYPVDVSAFVVGATPILKLFMQIKQMMLDLIEKLKESSPPEPSFEPITLPTLLYSIKSPSSSSSLSTAKSSSLVTSSSSTTSNRRSRPSSSTVSSSKKQKTD